MAKKETRPPLTAKDIKIGQWYRAKRFQRGLGCNNDRKVLWISPGRDKVQYDGDTVKAGRRYPTVTMEKFLKWASHEVTAAESEAST